ncbi:MAG: uroporphyrinogen decarboxylase family protein [Chloroflexota bacterium]
MAQLSHRERVRRALNHEEPDRVPLDLGGRVTSIHQEEYQRLVDRLGISTTYQVDPFYSVTNPDFRVLERLGVDFYYLFLKAPEYVRAKENPDGTYDNEWSITVKKVEIHSQRITHPLQNAIPSDLDDFPWPDPNRPERAIGLREKARNLYEQTDYALVAAPVNGGLFEFGQHLRSMAEFMMDLMINKDFANALLDRLMDVHLGLWDTFLAEVGEYIEIAQIADDFGTQNSLLISPTLFREFFKPRYKYMIDFIKNRTNAKVFLHCDGAIFDLIDDFIEMGVDVLNPLQPTAHGMDPARIKSAYGEHLAFHGAIDNQQLLPKGSVEEVRQAVKHVIDALAPGGGYILAAAHIIEPDVPVENVLAMFDTAREYGSYPIRSSDAI